MYGLKPAPLKLSRYGIRGAFGRRIFPRFRPAYLS
jgi:hypothetical protein